MSQPLLTDNPQVNAADFALAKRMAELLHAKYPGHLWGVTCESSTGIATVRNLRLSGMWGFVIKLRDLQHDPDLKCVMRAGGELLERYRMARGRFNEDEYDQLRLDNLGNFKADR